MGSTSDPETKGIDATVGGLVWVRRRNGSWWPGRIVGVDELPESCLMPPRSGTPVKLLGREDARVDWYNLQKCTRMKAFRCGEFDECIEKAKASAANSSKKAVKYARRDDAILLALELESARPSNDHPDFCPELAKTGGEQCLSKESPRMSHSDKQTGNTDEELSIFVDNSNELSQSGVSFEQPNQVKGRRRRTPNDSEDDGAEGVRRMRGLEDLGIGVVSLKRKRSQVAHVHEYLKRKNRRRPLTKVLESTVMVSVPVESEQLPSPTGSTLPGASDSKVSEQESSEPKISFSMVLNDTDSVVVSWENEISLNSPGHTSPPFNNTQKGDEISSMSGLIENDSSDKLFDVPFVREGKHSAAQKPQVGARAQSSQSSQVETVSFGNEELNECFSASSGAAAIERISKRIEKGSSSKWQSKGKRNTRQRSKKRRQDFRKSPDVDDESNAYLAGLQNRGSNGHISRTRELTANVKFLPDSSLTTPQRFLPYRQSRYALNPKYQTSDFLVTNDIAAGSSLYDVNLEVKTSYRPQRVPYVSLMSKLNDQPIIGHPLTVEVLDDGFCDLLLGDPPEANLSPSKAVDIGYEMKPNPVGGRVPKRRLKLQLRVSPSKSSKPRKKGLSSKKTRKLSSLSGSHKQSEDEENPRISKLNGPTLACVPLKVVFSRINESLNG